MSLPVLRTFLFILAFLLIAQAPAAAEAEPHGAVSLDGRLCHFASEQPAAAAALLAEPWRFACSPEQRHSPLRYNWLRADGLDVKSTAKDIWFLRFRNTLLDHLTVVFRYADGHVETFHASADEISALATAGNAIVIPIPPRDSAVRTVLIGVEGHPYTRIIARTPMLVSRSVLRSDAAQSNFLFGALFGLALAAAVLNLGFYRTLRLRFQLEMVGLAVAFLLYLVNWQGVLEQAGFATSLDWRAGGAFVLLGAILYTSVRFALAFLERASIWSPAAQAAKTAAIAAIIAAIGIPGAERSLTGFFDLAFHIFAAIGLLAMLVVISVALRRGSAAARFLLIGLAPAVVGGIIRVFYALNFSAPTAQGEIVMFIGATGMTLILCYAVADRVRQIQQAHDEARRRHGELTIRAERDGLTGLLNRRTFIEQVEMRLNFDVGDRLPVFIILDLDHFKRVNDMFGHEGGDVVLRQTAEILARTCRTGDIVGRLGGEEFGVLIAVREEREARIAAERLRSAISTAAIHKLVPGLTHISASFGVATAGECDCSWGDLYHRADQALYEAKSEGRNRVAIARAAGETAQAA